MAKKTFSELFSPKESKWSGLSLPMFLVLLILVALAVYVPFGGKELAFVRPNFLIIFTILAVFGVLFGEIGDRIPFWNDYIGGGTVLVFIASAVMGTYQLVPAKLLDSINVFYGEQPVNFLEIFIPALVVGSVLTVNRNVLVKAISGYIPLILIGVIGASWWNTSWINFWNKSTRCYDELCSSYNGRRYWCWCYSYVRNVGSKNW